VGFHCAAVGDCRDAACIRAGADMDGDRGTVEAAGGALRAVADLPAGAVGGRSGCPTELNFPRNDWDCPDAESIGARTARPAESERGAGAHICAPTPRCVRAPWLMWCRRRNGKQLRAGKDDDTQRDTRVTCPARLLRAGGSPVGCAFITHRYCPPHAPAARRAPMMPFTVTAPSRTAPPMKVLADAVSPRNAQTMMGDSTTSMLDNSAISAAGITLLPRA
jgi:hypothetical protein